MEVLLAAEQWGIPPWEVGSGKSEVGSGKWEVGSAERLKWFFYWEYVEAQKAKRNSKQ
jgi:hypothetical protein